MGKEILTFEDIEIENNKFFPQDSYFFGGGDLDIQKLLISDKYFIGYLYNGNKV